MGCMAVANRSLKHVSVGVILFYNTILGSFFSALYILIEFIVSGDEKRMGLGDYTGRQYLIASGASLFDLGVMGSLTLAYQSGASGFVSLFSYLNIVYGYLCDLFILKISLNAIEFCAASLILIVALTIGYYKLRKNNQKMDDHMVPLLAKADWSEAVIGAQCMN